MMKYHKMKFRTIETRTSSIERETHLLETLGLIPLVISGYLKQSWIKFM